MKSSTSSFDLFDNSTIKVELQLDDRGLVIRFILDGDTASPDSVLIHWGITLIEKPNIWVAPHSKLHALEHFQWNDRTNIVAGAAQTILKIENSSEHKEAMMVFQNVNTSTPLNQLPRTIEFVLYFPSKNRWVKNGKNNFIIPISSFLQSVFSETQLQDAAYSIVNQRLKQASSSLVKTYRWAVQSNVSTFSLLGFVFSDHLEYSMLYFFTDTPHPLLLHWGCSSSATSPWIRADTRQLLLNDPLDENNKEEFASHPFDEKALQTEFSFLSSSGESPIQYLRLVLGAPIVPPAIKFVLKEGKSNNWFKDEGNQDFIMEIPRNPSYQTKKKEFEEAEMERRSKEEAERDARNALWSNALERFRSVREIRKLDGNVTYKNIVLSDNIGEVDVVASFNEEESKIHVDVIGCLKCPATLHWGVIGEAGQRQRFAAQQWSCPPSDYRPKNTIVIDPKRSCETPFVVTSLPPTEKQADSTDSPLMAPFFQKVQILIPGRRDAPGSELDCGIIPEVGGIAFVLRETNGSQWFKAKDNSDIVIRLSSLATGAWTGALPEVVDEILGAEIGWHHMTLMHRNNLINGAVSKWHDNQTHDAHQFVVRSWTALFRPEGTRNVMDSPGKEVPKRKLSEGASLGQLDEMILKENCEFWSWMFVWSRFSYMGLLDWQRNYNTKPKDLAHSTESLTYKLSDLWIRWPEYRPLIRLVLSTVARGGNQGQAIRDRILDIMHRHKIPENNANFYEQWHQKLHNNTTPDDIPICLAVIQFLKTSNLKEYWKVLTDHGITSERLASYERKVISEPYLVHCDVGQLIHDFECYLDILRDVHDSLDLKKAFDHAIPFLPSDAIDCVRNVVNNTTVSGMSLRSGRSINTGLTQEQAHERFLAVSESRRRVIYHLTRPNLSPESVRELLFLDFALEQQQGLTLQGNATNFTVQQLSKHLTNMVVNMSGHHPTDNELNSISRDWIALSDDCALGSFSTKVESALMLKALADRVALLVGSLVQQWQEWFGPKSEFLGQQIGVEQHIINVFVDEVLRGSVLFGISITLKRLEPKLREAAQLPPWQMISIVPKVQGQLEKVEKLINIQAKIYDVPTILLSGSVSGEEEIPSGVQAVLVRSAAESPDILSHVSVRARNAHVLLGVCFDPNIAEDLDKLVGQWVELSVPSHGGGLMYSSMTPPDTEKLARKTSKILVHSFDRQRTQSDLMDDIALSGMKTTKMNLTTTSAKWVVMPKEFSRAVVGSKSLNLAKLRPLLPSDVITPQAVALPYGCLQKTLAHPNNKGRVLDAITNCLGQLKPDTPNSQAAFIFREARECISQLVFPNEFKQELRLCMQESEVQGSQSLVQLYDKSGGNAAWNSICSVWASLFGLRPWVSLSKAGRQYHELNMAVLIQELLPANYAFVLHSRNPFDTEVQNEMYGEIVPGLGEVLVGNAPGRALSWKMKKGGDPSIVSFPSKQFALKGTSCLIFRSDSNGEDLEGFAGAGLFESIPAEENEKLILSYSTLKLVRDSAYRMKLLKKIGDLAFSIEDIFGASMDIEGVVMDDETLGVVQARPQVCWEAATTKGSVELKQHHFGELTTANNPVFPEARRVINSVQLIIDMDEAVECACLGKFKCQVVA